MMKPLLQDTFAPDAVLPSNDLQVVNFATLSPSFKRGFLLPSVPRSTTRSRTEEDRGKLRKETFLACSHVGSLHIDEQVFYNAVHGSYHHEKTWQGVSYA